MSDRETPLAELKALVADFVQERDWMRFHSPKNITMSLTIEAAELMEHFQWVTTDASRTVAHDPEKRSAIQDELANVMCYVIALANELELDITSSVRTKMAKNAVKYPSEEHRRKFGDHDSAMVTDKN